MSETDNELIVMVGLPMSGKTTEALKTELPIVCPDAIRLALHGQAFIRETEPMVWTFAKYMVKSLFLAGFSQVIVDATNTTVARRDEWADKMWRRRFHVCDTRKEVCIRRCDSIEDGLLRERIIQTIERMASNFEKPTSSEHREWEV